jgi:superfamily II DNA or RNA helicase
MTRTAQLQISSWQDIADHFPGVQPIADMEDNGEIEFRSYQALATASVLFSGYRGVVRAATGSGKTLIASAICGSFFPRKTVVMISGTALIEQTYQEFARFLGPENVGFITPDGFEPSTVTIASINTFSFYLNKKGVPVKKKTGVPIMDPKKFEKEKTRFVKYLENEVDMLMFDECHHGSADSWQDIGKATEAYYRVGLSGTPLKHDELSDMLMISLVGPVVFDLNARWLQEHSYLAKARLEIKTLDFTSEKTRKMNYQTARKELLVSNTDRHVEIASDIRAALMEPNTRMLVLTGNSVEMAESIYEELNALTRPLQRQLGYRPFEVVSGQSSSKKVTRSFERLRRGDLQCVITTKIADEGIDIPSVNLLFLVGGGKAYVAAVQRIGRGLRRKEGDGELVVRDYFTNGNKYTERHDRQRLKVYEGENFFYRIDHVD